MLHIITQQEIQFKNFHHDYYYYYYYYFVPSKSLSVSKKKENGMVSCVLTSRIHHETCIQRQFVHGMTTDHAKRSLLLLSVH